MAELLNLDELVSVKRVVTIRGVEYTLADQTVDQMLEGIKKAKQAEKSKKKQDVEDILADMKATCQQVLPECPAEVIGAMNMKQTIALIEFAAKPADEVEAVATEDEEGKPAGKPE